MTGMSKGPGRDPLWGIMVLWSYHQSHLCERFSPRHRHHSLTSTDMHVGPGNGIYVETLVSYGFSEFCLKRQLLLKLEAFVVS